MVAARNAWKGKRVFLTGHTGFKGSWLALWLQELGAEVLGYSLQPPTQPSLFEVAKIDAGMRTVIADIRDLPKLTAKMKEFRPDAVFHLAAQSLVHASYEDPVGTYSANVMGTVNVLEAARSAASVRAIVVVTSDKCYENNEWVWGYRESDAMGGYDPYSNSKGCAELVTSAYRRSFFNPDEYARHGVALASGRAGNVIGGGDWARDRLVPDFIRAVSEGRAMQIRRPGAARPWQHVLEPLSGYLCLGEHLLGPRGNEFASGWNFGPKDDSAIPVGDFVKKLAARWEGAQFELSTAQPAHEAQFLKLDCSKARAKLGWAARLEIDTAIAWTVDWHRAMIDSADMRAETLRQINQFDATPMQSAP